MNQVEHAYQQACEHLPRQWYEKESLRASVYIAMAVTIWLLLQEMTPEVYVNAQSVSVIVYLIGTILDTYSTKRVADTSERAEQYGVAPVKEKSWYFPKTLNSADIYNLRKYPSDIIFALLTYIFPYMGIPLGVLRILAMKNNLRIEQRLEMVISYIDQSHQHHDENEVDE